MPDPLGAQATADRPPVDGTDPEVRNAAAPAFPELAGRAGRRRSGRWAPVRVLLVVVVLAAAVTAWIVTRPSGPPYRTATVSTGTAVSLLSAVGTISPVQQADLSFAAAGTVGAVDVTVGQQVVAGQVLATLDPTSLQSAVVNTAAVLAGAQNTLATDEATQASARPSTSTTASSTGTASTGSVSTGTPSVTTAKSGGAGGAASGASGGSGGSGASSAAVTQAQATLVADQKKEDAAATAAGAALQQATTVCTGVGGGGATCTQDLAAASTAHTTLVTAIATVTKDEAVLSAALGLVGPGGGGPGGGQGGAPTTTTTTTTAPSTTTTTTAPGGSSSGSGSHTSSTGSSAGSSSGAHAKTVTPELIALDQANIDVAQANADAAQADLDQGNLVSTMAGTVGSVTLTPGQSVSAGSPASTPQLVVVGTGSDYQLTTTVPVTKIGQVTVGQQALVTPDSGTTALDGTVTSVGVLGTTTSTTTTYPVTIALTSPDLGAFSGLAAGIQIVTARATDVTTVPTSAVRTVGRNRVVTVVGNGGATTVRVTVGTVGALLTQILTGVHVGESVSLATMSAPVPSSSTLTRSAVSGLGGAGGLGGSGLGGAGGLGGGRGFGGAVQASGG